MLPKHCECGRRALSRPWKSKRYAIRKHHPLCRRCFERVRVPTTRPVGQEVWVVFKVVSATDQVDYRIDHGRVVSDGWGVVAYMSESITPG